MNQSSPVAICENGHPLTHGASRCSCGARIKMQWMSGSESSTATGTGLSGSVVAPPTLQDRAPRIWAGLAHRFLLLIAGSESPSSSFRQRTGSTQSQ